MDSTSQDKKERIKGKFKLFFEKWMIVMVLFTLSAAFFQIDYSGIHKHYPKLSELQHVYGTLEYISVIDTYKNHKATMRVRGENATFVFKKVDFIHKIKEVTSKDDKNTKLDHFVELWVDKDQYNKGISPEIWQLSIDNTMIMSRDEISKLMFDRYNSGFKPSLYLFIAGVFFTILLNSKNIFVTNKLYPLILAAIGLIAAFYWVYIMYSALTSKGGLNSI